MEAIWKKELRPGEKWSGGIGKNKSVRFTALGDNANLSVLLYNYYDRVEKYSMTDTLKAQHKMFLSEGDILMSDNGCVLAAIVKDSIGWHDAISGYTTRLMTDEKYGKTSFQEQGNDFLRSGEENLKIELIRNGLHARDITPCVNLFSKVTIGEDGGMRYDPAHCPKGAVVEIKIEMAVLIVLSNTPNPLDPSTNYPSVPIRVEVFEVPETGAEDPWVVKHPESTKAYNNTRLYHRLLGL